MRSLSIRSFCSCLARHSALFVARDRLGRRSLLAARNAEGCGVASVGSASWSELPVSGLFVFLLEDRSVRQLPWQQPAPFGQPWWWTEATAFSAPSCFARVLREAVARRVSHVAEGTRVGVLFSGGLDSTVLAALAAEHCDSVELINVAFDGKAPDRLTALRSYEDLVKRYGAERFRLILADASLEEVLAEEQKICRLLGPKASHLDFNIAAALWFAARGRGLVCSPDFIQAPWWTPSLEAVQLEPPRQPKVTEKLSCKSCVLPAKPGCAFESCKLCCRKLHRAAGEPREWCPVHVKIEAAPLEELDLSARRCAQAPEVRAACRVLLVGTGADELLGGYSRHRTARAKRGVEGTRLEMMKDLERLWTRNLGRDDRIISDHGREARHPFLDDHFLDFVGRLPIELLAYGPKGEADPAPDKWMLRELAVDLGLEACAQFKKRAIQFGTRMAKQSNVQHAGSNRQVRGDMAYCALSEEKRDC